MKDLNKIKREIEIEKIKAEAKLELINCLIEEQTNDDNKRALNKARRIAACNQ